MFSNSKIQCPLVFIFCLISFLPAALLVDVFQVSEAREGVVVQQILATDNWVLPLRHGLIVPSKPPLFHWVGASFAKLFGQYNLFLLRLPSMLGASLLLVSFFILAKYLLGNFYGLLATLALQTTSGFFHLAVDGRVDMLFAAFVFIAISLWLTNAISVIQERKSYRDIPEIVYFLVAISCGLAVLTKGPLGLVLPSITIFLIAFALWGIFGALSTIRISWAVAIILPAFWYYLAWQEGGDSFVHRHLFFENLQRFSGGKGVNQKPWWFYLTHIWLQAAPWSLLLFVPAFFKKIYQNLKQKNPAMLSLSIWIISSLLLFTLSSGKRRAYLLPILPPLILLLSIIAKELIQSTAFQRKSERIREWFKSFQRCLVVSLLPFCLVLFAYLLACELANFELSLRTKMALNALFEIFSNNSLVVIFLLLILAMFSAFFFAVCSNRKKIEYFFLGILLVNLQIIALVLPFFSSIKSITHSMSALTKLASDAVPKGETLTAVKFYKDESLDVFFYLYNRPTSILKPSQLGNIKAGYFISAVRYMPRIDRSAMKSGKEIERIAVGKRPSDNDDESFVIFKVL